LPPGGFIFSVALGLLCLKKYPRLGYSLSFGGLALLYLLSLPATAVTMMSWLEPSAALTEAEITIAKSDSEHSPQAIVILGAGRHYNSPEFSADSPNAMALERIRYGVWLARRSLLPLLVSGGLGNKAENILSEAQLMKQLIESEYALPVRWAETQSRNTYENAQFSVPLLKSEGITRIYLVSHALHMRRSVAAFERQGITVFPAPTVFNSRSQRAWGLNMFLPSAYALHNNTRALHEWFGMLWYRLRY
jgi:uncharacterized SAM-binding protein YcdF (DUF218 family)